MHHRVNLAVSGWHIFPGAGEDGDNPFERGGCCSGYSFSTTTDFEECADLSFHRPFAHPQQLPRGVCPVIPHMVALQNDNVFLCHWMEQFAAHFIPCFPDVFECCSHIRGVGQMRAGFLFRGKRTAHLFSAEHSDDRLAVYAKHCREIVKKVMPFLA